MRLEPVVRTRLPAVWPQIAHWLTRVNKRFSPWLRMADPFDKCRTGHAQLWLIRDGEAVKGIVITQITTDAERVAEVPVVAGEDMDSWLHLLDGLEHWARREGCVAMVSTAAREGWVKILAERGWKKQAVLMERRL